MRKMRWVLSWAAALSLGAGLAHAQPTPPPPGKHQPPGARHPGGPQGKPEEHPGKRGGPQGKPGEHPGKPGEQDGAWRGNEGKPGNPASRPQGNEDRQARRKRQVEQERAKINESVKRRPMDDELKEEMRQHAERVARLERIQAVAEAKGDTASAERAKRLLEQENARYQAVLEARK